PRQPRAIGIDMIDVLLSSPAFYLYLAAVAVLLVAAFWNRQADPPVGGADVTTPPTGPPSGTYRWQQVAPWALPPRTPRGLFSDLQANLSAGYVAGLEQAIRTIRAEPYAGGPTDPAAD